MIITNKHFANKNLHSFDPFFSAFPVNWGRDAKAEYSPAPTNISENADEYLLELLVPGRNKEDFSINVEKGILTISYQKKEEAENKDVKSIRREFGFSSFKRSFSLDEKINTEGINAKYDNGVLSLHLPKKEDVKVAPKHIAIQ